MPRRSVAEKPKNLRLAIKNLITNMRPYLGWIIVAILFAIGSSVLAIVGPNKLKDITNLIEAGLDALKTNPQAKIDLAAVTRTAITLVVIYLASGLFSFFEQFIMATESNRFVYGLRARVSHKINQLPLAFFDTHTRGDILSRVTNDIDTLGTTLSRSIGSMVGAIALVIGSVIMMFVTNALMALTAILASIIGLAFMTLILKNSQKYFIMQQVELGKLNGHIEEAYSAHNLIRAYNAEGQLGQNFNKLNKNLYTSNKKSHFLSGLMQPLMNFVGNLGYLAVCVVGALLIIKTGMDFGVVVAFIIYVRLFSSPLSQIAQGMTSLQSAIAASERVFEVLNEKEMATEEHCTKQIDIAKAKGNIKFEHVKFGYDKDKVIIKDFSCNVRAGQKVAIVGPTGAGKTTLVNLLMKFYEIDGGDIIIDGVSIHELKRENVHSLFTMILQDTWLFNGSIKENICYNRTDVSDEKVWEVLKILGIEKFVLGLPGGLNSQLDEGKSISAGQKQLLTIARGMIEDSPFLILDEATSSVDTRTEELVQKAMDKLMQNRTSFIIAHRLSTIKNADIILVLDKGNIVEQGTHKQLIAKNGFYASLYNSQFKK